MNDDEWMMEVVVEGDGDNCNFDARKSPVRSPPPPAHQQLSPSSRHFCFIQIHFLAVMCLKPSILGQNRSETKKIGLGLAHSGLGIGGLMLCCETRSCHTLRSCHARRHNDLEGHSNFSGTIYCFSILCLEHHYRGNQQWRLLTKKSNSSSAFVYFWWSCLVILVLVLRIWSCLHHCFLEARCSSCCLINGVIALKGKKATTEFTQYC